MRLAIGVALLTTAASPTPSWTLTPTGWGPAQIGMTRAQVSKALNVELEGDGFDSEGNCQELVGAHEAFPGLFFMFERGRLTRITTTEPSVVATPRGIHVGSTHEEVRKAYGKGLKAEPHHYEAATNEFLTFPAEYLTFWLKPGRSGVRFEMDTQGKVESIHAGTSSIQYAEGCA
jgi:hypothetical protein